MQSQGGDTDKNLDNSPIFKGMDPIQLGAPEPIIPSSFLNELPTPKNNQTMDFTDVSFSKELAQNDPILVNDEGDNSKLEFSNIFEQN